MFPWIHGMFRVMFRIYHFWTKHDKTTSPEHFLVWLALFELFFYRRLGDKETKMMIWPVDTACVNQREISGRTKDGYSHRDWGYSHSNGGWLWQATHGKHHVADKYSLACFFKGGFSIDKWMIWIDPLVLWKVINNPLINVFFFSWENHRRISGWISGRGADDTRLIKPFEIFWWLPRWESSCILLRSDGYHRFLILNKMIPQNMLYLIKSRIESHHMIAKCEVLLDSTNIFWNILF
jgi:hypothetical protein